MRFLTVVVEAHSGTCQLEIIWNLNQKTQRTTKKPQMLREVWKIVRTPGKILATPLNSETSNETIKC